jgi:hypothetical protein
MKRFQIINIFTICHKALKLYWCGLPKESKRNKFLQAVTEVAETVIPFIEQNKKIPE